MMDILKKEYIFLNESFKDQNEVFEFISNKAVEMNFGDNKNDVYRALKSREKEASTGLQDGIAIPHAISSSIHKPAILFIRSKTDILDWSTIDETKVTQIIAMLVPENNENQHLQILSDVAGNLIDEDKRQLLISSKDENEVLNILNS